MYVCLGVSGSPNVYCTFSSANRPCCNGQYCCFLEFQVTYATFGLGDSSYPKFNYAAKRNIASCKKKIIRGANTLFSRATGPCVQAALCA